MRSPAFVLRLAAAAASLLWAAAAQDYTYSCFGRCDQPRASEPLGGLVLMGGSTDVDAAFAWMARRCNGGDFLVLRASGGSGYNDYIHGFGHSNSVSTIVLHRARAAADPFVLGKIAGACAIWFAGGDQAIYYLDWQGTPLQRAVQDAYTVRNAPVGGTSAGMEILAYVVYTGEKGSVTSAQALANPFHPYVTLRPAWLDVPAVRRMPNDMHFYERDRMGRLLVFMARSIQEGMIPDPAAGVPAIACDEETALTVDPETHVATLRGYGYGYMLLGYQPDVCRPDTPLTYRNITAVRLQDGDTFSLPEWRSLSGGVPYAFDVVDGKYEGTPYGPKAKGKGKGRGSNRRVAH